MRGTGVKMWRLETQRTEDFRKEGKGSEEEG